jgi:triosephosphate isomerase (TIM)
VAQGKLIVGNWKMNGNMASLEVAKAIAAGATKRNTIVICPPTTLIIPMAEAVKGSGLHVGAQDCHTKTFGAHTGDISASMLADAGATYVIVGHSERRADHDETNDSVRAKAAAATTAGLKAIICVGESEAQRDEGRAVSVVIEQVFASVPVNSDANSVAIAYEPVWAIGTGRTPSVNDVEIIHGEIRAALQKSFGKEVGAAIAILYGGSVNAANAADLLSIPNVDGALVGGASLKAVSFLAICSV